MSLWVQRTSTGGGTLVHYSTQTDGQGRCTVPIGFSSAGNIIATAWVPDNQVTGPVLSINTWTHIATTYSQMNGLTLYVNGVSVGSTGAQNYNGPSTIVILTLGNSLSGGGCGFRSMVPCPFSGYLDEFRVYSRELSATDVFVLSRDKTCFDGLMNGDETDIDCGGSCLTCDVDSPCQSLTYSAYIYYSTGNQPWSISIADLDNDNSNDIIVLNAGDANLGIYFNQENGTFQTPIILQTANYPVFVGSVDLNKDNNLDLIVAQAKDNSIGLFLGLGNKSFNSRMNIAVGSYPYGIGIGDFNKDDNLDLVAVNDHANTASVLFGYSNGSFESASTLSTGSYVTAVAVA
ncbi:unnamed protein product, partial [Adineta steineri]